MSSVRLPAVAGAFYPSDAGALRDTVDRLLAEVARVEDGYPRALVAPHAGYAYSGPVAASAFRPVTGARFARVVVIGPSHYVPFRGIAVPHAEVFATPLGEVPLDVALRAGGDAGKPIVESDPTSPAAAALRAVAERLGGRGRGLAGMQLGLTPTSKF